LPKQKEIIKRMMIKFDRKKNYRGWNCNKKINLENHLKKEKKEWGPNLKNKTN